MPGVCMRSLSQCQHRFLYWSYAMHLSQTSLISFVSVLVIPHLHFRNCDAAITVAPHNTTALLGGSITLKCSTNITSSPVNWFCSGTCSANTTATAVYLVLTGVLTESYSHRIQLVRNTATYVLACLDVVYCCSNSKLSQNRLART